MQPTHNERSLPPRSWAQVLEKEGKIAKFVPVDFTDAETVFDRCMQVRLVWWRRPLSVCYVGMLHG